MHNLAALGNLKWDNITKAGLVNFFSALYFYLPIGTLWYRSKGLSYTQIASLTSIIIGTIFLANVPTGILADRIGTKYSIVAALALQLAGEVLFFFSDSYLLFAVTALLAGLGFAFMTGAFQALIFDSLKEQGREQEMQKVVGSIEAMKGLATILGAGASSVILSSLTTDRFSLAIVLTWVTVGMGLATSLLLREPQKAYASQIQNPRQIVLESVQLLRTNGLLRRIVLLSLITSPFDGYLRSLFQPYFQLSQVPSPWFGLALAISGVVALFASKYAYLLAAKLGQQFALLVFTALPGLLYILMSLLFDPAIAVLLFCLNLGSMELRTPLFADYTNRQIQSSNRATVLSVISVVTSGYVAIMGPIIGRIADVSVPLSFVFMGIIILLGALLLRLDESHVALARPNRI